MHGIGELFLSKHIMLTIKQTISKLDQIDMPFGEKQQLSSLVREFGLLGAIEYLQPLKKHYSIIHRDQKLADRHKDILMNL